MFIHVCLLFVETDLLNICSPYAEYLPLQGYLTSTDYPHLYPTTTECKVTLPAQAGDEVHIQIKDLYIETRKATACLDYLMIQDTGRPKAYKYCETSFNTTSPVNMMVTVKDRLEVHFRSDTTLDRLSRGFILSYKGKFISATKNKRKKP